MHPSSIRGGHKYSKSGPKPAGASSCLSAKTAQCLIALPLVLALFALSLQVSIHQHLAVCPHSRKDAPRSVCCVVDHPRQNRSKAASVHARGLCHQVCQPIFSMSCTMQPYSETFASSTACVAVIGYSMHSCQVAREKSLGNCQTAI